MMPRTLVALAALCACVAGCNREARGFHDLPASAARPSREAQTPLVPGGAGSASSSDSPYRGNAWGISEGKRLYNSFNCFGCHAQGGGGIGPPLMDDEWIYGFEPANVYSTIVEGRPNGMPAFGKRLGNQQVWQLVAYVESMSGQTPTSASPGRSDHMRAHPPESISPFPGRRQTGHR